MEVKLLSESNQVEMSVLAPSCGGRQLTGTLRPVIVGAPKELATRPVSGGSTNKRI